MNVVFRSPGSEWAAFEERLCERGVALTLYARSAYARSPGRDVWLFGLTDEQGTPLWATGVHVTRSRALLGSLILRVPRFGDGLPPALAEAACDGLAELARSVRAVRIHAELYAPHGPGRDVLLRQLERSGFRSWPTPRSYQRTILIDLRVDEGQLFASLHPTGRRHIRALAKHGLECVAIVDGSLAARMADLLSETMERTGGPRIEMDWKAWLQLAAEQPGLVKIFGVFHPQHPGDRLVGYVLGTRHGDTVEYAVAASARLEDCHVPLLYAPTWELIRWAKATGASMFDFGGITLGTAQSGDPVGGISAFKRYFSTNVVEVGGEFVYEPSRWRARAASGVQSAVRVVRRLLG